MTRLYRTHSVESEDLPTDFQLHRALKLLINLDSIGKRKVANPYLFRGAPMVTTFVYSTGIRMKAVWNVLEKASQADIRLAELEHPSLKKMSFCLGRVPIYGDPCFYRSLKLQYPRDERKQIILVGDWNVIFDPKIDMVEWGSSGSDRCESSLIDLMAQQDLVDSFHLDHPGREM